MGVEIIILLQHYYFVYLEQFRAYLVNKNILREERDKKKIIHTYSA